MLVDEVFADVVTEKSIDMAICDNIEASFDGVDSTTSKMVFGHRIAKMTLTIYDNYISKYTLGWLNTVCTIQRRADNLGIAKHSSNSNSSSGLRSHKQQPLKT